VLVNIELFCPIEKKSFSDDDRISSKGKPQPEVGKAILSVWLSLVSLCAGISERNFARPSALRYGSLMNVFRESGCPPTPLSSTGSA